MQNAIVALFATLVFFGLCVWLVAQGHTKGAVAAGVAAFIFAAKAAGLADD